MATFKFQNKYACGAYFNMARDNFHRTFMDMLHQVGYGAKFTETGLDVVIEEIIGVLKGDAPTTIGTDAANLLIANQSRIKQMLFRSYPILAPVVSDIMRHRHNKKVMENFNSLSEDEQKEWKNIKKENKRDDQLSSEERRIKKKMEVNDDGDRDATCIDCLEALYVFGCCLTDCRNFFTHYKPYNSQGELEEIYERQIMVARWLSPVFTASRRLDKKRNRLSSAEMEFITNNNMKVKLDENGEKVQDDEGKDVYIKNHDYYFSIVGESFVSKSEVDVYSQKMYEGDEVNFGNSDNYALSDFGLLYLCCCFITRPQAKLFATQISLFANSPSRNKNSEYDELLNFSLLPGLDDKRKKRLKVLKSKLKAEHLDLRRVEDREELVAMKEANISDDDYDYLLTLSMKESPTEEQVNQIIHLKTKLNVEHLDLSREEDRQKLLELKADNIVDKDNYENELIQEMLSIYRIRLPKGKRLDKQDNIATVALDMMNELRRCPRELYNILPPAGQKVFEDPADTDSGGACAVTERIRYTDRFPYLALRAIDEMKSFSNIRFQVQLGYYRYSFYDKFCIDGSEQLRRIGKSINGFGRLSAIENKRKSEWSLSEDSETQVANKMQLKIYAPTLLEDGKTTLDLLRPVEDKAGNEPYITDWTAFYNIHNNRIGLYWERGTDNKLKSDDVLLFPELNASETDKSGHRKADVLQKAPLCSLSVRDLPAMLFLIHLSYGRNAENIIINKYNGLLQFFTDLSRNPKDNNAEPSLETIIKDIEEKGLETVLANRRYGLKLSEIPNRIKESLVDYIQNMGKASAQNSDVIGYFTKRLKGTKYELPENVTVEEIVELVSKLGVMSYDERYGNIPARKRPEKTPEIIKELGIAKVLLLAKDYEEIPDKILNLFGLGKETGTYGTIQNTDNAVFARFKEMLVGRKDKKGNHIKGRLEQRREWVERQLDKLKTARKQQFAKENRYATKSYKDVRYGRLAEILAESMLMWQPTAHSEGHDKLTGLNYRKLVDFLATYNYKASVVTKEGERQFGLDALKRVLTEAKLLGSEIPHPFLLNLFKEKDNQEVPTNIEDLFHKYMECEKNMLIKLEAIFKDMDENTPIEIAIAQAPAFVHPKRERWILDNRQIDDIRKMATNYVKPGNTLLLPDGLFTDAIIAQLRQRNLLQEVLAEPENETDPEQATLLEERNRNVSFLISRYIEKMGDHCQSFYDGNTGIFYRGYDLFKKLYGEKLGNEQFHKYYSRENIIAKLRDKKNQGGIIDKIDQYCIDKNMPEAKVGMLRDINRIKNNERAILRYKIQDIVLFLTAKNMLISQQKMNERNIITVERQNRHNLGRNTLATYVHRMELAHQRLEKINNMKLMDVFDGDALNVTMDYEYKVVVNWSLKDENGRTIKFREDGTQIPFDEHGIPVEKNGRPKEFRRNVYITQENVAVKNFGRIFRIIKDDRLNELLLLLIIKREGLAPGETGPEYFVSVAELANEFTQLDSKRVGAFEVIQDLEKTAYPRLSDPHSGATYEFKNMMRLICSEQEADAVNQYRVSFAHSKYGVEAQVFGENTHLEVPVVSQIMEEQIHIRSNEIKDRLNREQ